MITSCDLCSLYDVTSCRTVLLQAMKIVAKSRLRRKSFPGQSVCPVKIVLIDDLSCYLVMCPDTCVPSRACCVHVHILTKFSLHRIQSIVNCYLLA